MKLLLFEWLVGGGCWHDRVPLNPLGSLPQQGQQMLQALGQDLLAAGVELMVPIDSRFHRTEMEWEHVKWLSVDSSEALQICLIEQAEISDAIILIAPETNGCLATCCRWLDPFRDKFLSPNLEFIELTSDKEATSHWLQARGIPVPAGCRLSDFDFQRDDIERRFPLVIKPLDGAGSEDIQIISAVSDFRPISNPDRFRIEEFVRGEAVSVSFLCDLERNAALPPTGQIFETQPIGKYIGCRFPLPIELASRATALAQTAIDALPRTRGYVGIDLVVAFDGPQYDCIVDVNPRLTTSYLRLREICGFNIAERILPRDRTIYRT